MKKVFLITDSYGTIIAAKPTRAEATAHAKALEKSHPGQLYSAEPKAATIAGISIFGKRHTDKNGNTYHSTQSCIFFTDGRAARIDNRNKFYGYGEQYIYTALKLMAYPTTAGFLPEGVTLMQLREAGIPTFVQAADVKSAKEL